MAGKKKKTNKREGENPKIKILSCLKTCKDTVHFHSQGPTCTLLKCI